MVPEIHDALFDSWMLKNFPGRTLDELDNMDIMRYLRAMEARQLESIKETRSEIKKKGGRIKSSDLSSSQWEEIKTFDKLVDAFRQRFEVKDGR